MHKKIFDIISTFFLEFKIYYLTNMLKLFIHSRRERKRRFFFDYVNAKGKKGVQNTGEQMTNTTR